MALLPVDEALAKILDGVKPLSAEPVKLENAIGRVLATPVIAKRNQPPFAASAMDGYALRHVDQLKPLTLIGTSAAGHAFKGHIKPGTCVRILTGAPLPQGADTVVIQENVGRNGAIIRVQTETPLAKNIRRAGLDFGRGDILLEANTKLRPRDLGLAAAGNAPTLKLRRQPHVVLFTTGDELVLPGHAARADQIYSSNSHAIEAMATSLGARVTNLGIIRDSLAATRAAIRKGLKADILVTTGGASVGDHDYVQEAFKASGIKINFWKIAMRPGKPFMHGRKGRLHVMGLPGNPVSALVTARLFLKPLVEAMLGLAPDEDAAVAILTEPLRQNDDRQDYIRAALTTAPDGRRSVCPFPLQDSSMQRTLQQSNALIIRDPHASAAKPGDIVRVLPLDF